MLVWKAKNFWECEREPEIDGGGGGGWDWDWGLVLCRPTGGSHFVFFPFPLHLLLLMSSALRCLSSSELIQGKGGVWMISKMIEVNQVIPSVSD